MRSITAEAKGHRVYAIERSLTGLSIEAGEALIARVFVFSLGRLGHQQLQLPVLGARVERGRLVRGLTQRTPVDEGGYKTRLRSSAEKLGLAL